jgi:hypothetical protein
MKIEIGKANSGDKELKTDESVAPTSFTVYT